MSHPRAPDLPTPLELTGRSRQHVVAVDGVVLQADAQEAFRALREAAAEAGFDLAVASSFRDFDTQVRIWNQKWRGERPLLDRNGHTLRADGLSATARVQAILLWSAPPGASRHHWGSDLDVYDRSALAVGDRPALVPAEYGPGGPFSALNDWLTRHMAAYGFYRPYVKDLGGVQPEPWHLSHAPTARRMSRCLRPSMVATAIRQGGVDGSDVLIADWSDIYRRFVRAVEPPPPGLRA